MFSEKLWKAKVRDILENYQKKVVAAVKNGYDGVEDKWSFAGAFLYSLTVITTIGECSFISLNVSVYIFRISNSSLNNLFGKKIDDIFDFFNSTLFLSSETERNYVASRIHPLLSLIIKRERVRTRKLLKNVDNLLAPGYLAVLNRARLFALLMPGLMPTFLVATDKSP